MSLIRDNLARLDEKQRKRLMYAFETESTEIIFFDDETFVGCNLSYVEHLVILETRNSWAAGRKKRNGRNGQP